MPALQDMKMRYRRIKCISTFSCYFAAAISRRIRARPGADMMRERSQRDDVAIAVMSVSRLPQHSSLHTATAILMPLRHAPNPTNLPAQLEAAKKPSPYRRARK